ncbi:MAG: PLP-dependent lyase/thiolase [Candidatus Magasanikbacteria bacterium]|nr:PLP-dependent lyase/thiolase [Candidatus Magasanikbacteria bacterium]
MQTPQPSYTKLAQTLGVPELYLKREDLSPYGSHKGRSIPHMIKTYIGQGNRNFVISSSGNAALAAIHTVVEHNKNNPAKTITLKIFVGEKINPTKLEHLKATGNQSPPKAGQSAISISQVQNPKQMAFQMDKDGKAKTLRQSNDDLALVGYNSLATELNQIPNLNAIFVPTSSGTTAQALGEWFGTHNPSVQIHIVQTTAVHPIAKEFDKKFTKQNESVAGAIVDNIAHRKDKVLEIIKKFNGSGWIASDEEINEAIKLVEENTEIEISPNSALSVAGLKKATGQGSKFSGPVACLITGA